MYCFKPFLNCCGCGCNKDTYQREGGATPPEIEYVIPNEVKLNEYKLKFDLYKLRSNPKEGVYSYGSFFSSENGRSGYIFLHKETNIGDRPQDKGWKIHVSIKPEAIDQAWEIIMPILIENGVYLFKVAALSDYKKYILEGFQPGKEIVIYVASSKVNLDWCNILCKINTELREKDVRADDNGPPKFREANNTKEATDIVEPQILVNNDNGYFYLSDDSKNRGEFQDWISALNKNDRSQPILPIDNWQSLMNPPNRLRFQHRP